MFLLGVLFKFDIVIVITRNDFVFIRNSLRYWQMADTTANINVSACYYAAIQHIKARQPLCKVLTWLISFFILFWEVGTLVFEWLSELEFWGQFLQIIVVSYLVFFYYVGNTVDKQGLDHNSHLIDIVSGFLKLSSSNYSRNSLYISLYILWWNFFMGLLLLNAYMDVPVNMCYYIWSYPFSCIVEFMTGFLVQVKEEEGCCKWRSFGKYRSRYADVVCFWIVRNFFIVILPF